MESDYLFFIRNMEECYVLKSDPNRVHRAPFYIDNTLYCEGHMYFAPDGKHYELLKLLYPYVRPIPANIKKNQEWFALLDTFNERGESNSGRYGNPYSFDFVSKLKPIDNPDCEICKAWADLHSIDKQWFSHNNTICERVNGTLKGATDGR
jgi:hypothetical protein